MRRSTSGADIPPELFRHIIDHLHVAGRGTIPGFYHPGVQNASLVCVYWAQHCRPIQFSTRAVVKTTKQAEGLRNLVMTARNSRLTPLGELIQEVGASYTVLQDSRSWIHILGALIPVIPLEKFGWLHIVAPGGETSVPSTMLRSLLLSIPKSLIPLSTPFRELCIEGLHFASLQDIWTLINQFPSLEKVCFQLLVWDKDEVHATSRPRNVVPLKYCRLTSIDVKNCRDDVLLWQTVTFRLRLCALHTLVDVDQRMIHEVITGTQSAHKALVRDGPIYASCKVIKPNNDEHSFIARVDIGIGFVRNGSSTQAFSIYFICQTSPPWMPPDMINSSRVTGCVVILGKGHKRAAMGNVFPHGLELWSSITRFPSLVHLVIALEGFELSEIAALVEAHPALGVSTVHFARFEEKHRNLISVSGYWDEVDSVSLEKTGTVWKDDDDLATELFKRFYA